MGVLQHVYDGLQNVVANLGTSRDKAAHTTFVFDQKSDAELSNIYRSSSTAQKIVDFPAEDSIREWREWQAQKEQIEAIEAEEARLEMVAKIYRARTMARLFGGAAIFIGTGDQNVGAPLLPDRIGRGGIEYLTVMKRREVVPGDIQRDPRMPGYGLPSWYRLSTGSGSMVQIHPSRFVIFQGKPILDDTLAGNSQGWSDSELAAVMDKINYLDSTLANVASLVFEAKVDVFKIPDLMSNLQTGGKEYEATLLRRLTLAATAKGINGALLMDAAEDYEQKSANFSTLPDIIDRFMQSVSGASGIPMTRLFGMSPGGLNSTGEGDTRSYYDRVRFSQTTDMTPAMALLDECLIRSALGSRPPEVHYAWRPLWQPSAKERADIGKVHADTAKVLTEIGAPDEPVVTAAVNAITESGAMPGLEGAMSDFYGEADGGNRETEEE